MLFLPVPDGAVPLSCCQTLKQTRAPAGSSDGRTSQQRAQFLRVLSPVRSLGLRGHLAVKSWASSVILGVLMPVERPSCIWEELLAVSPIFHEENKKSSLPFPRDPAGDLGSAGQRWPVRGRGLPLLAVWAPCCPQHWGGGAVGASS